MAKALTARQQQALDKIYSQSGSFAGIGSGMIAALARKGALDGVQVEQQTAARKTKTQEPQGLPDYTTKSWASLSDLRERILQDAREEVQSFDGAQLITDNRTFSLAFGELSVQYRD